MIPVSIGVEYGGLYRPVCRTDVKKGLPQTCELSCQDLLRWVFKATDEGFNALSSGCDQCLVSPWGIATSVDKEYDVAAYGDYLPTGRIEITLPWEMLTSEQHMALGSNFSDDYHETPMSKFAGYVVMGDEPEGATEAYD